MVHDGQWPWMFAFMAGLMFYTIYSKKHSWMSRLAIGSADLATPQLEFSTLATR